MVINSKLVVESESRQELQSRWRQQSDMVTSSARSQNTNGGVAEFYLISELSQISGVNCGAIRFYESQGLLAPTRHGKMRVYMTRDADRLKHILELRSLGLPVKMIRKLFEQAPEISHRPMAESLRLALQEHKTDLLRRQSEIEIQLKAVTQKLGEPPEGG